MRRRTDTEAPALETSPAALHPIEHSCSTDNLTIAQTSGASGIDRLYISRREGSVRWGIGSTSLDILLSASDPSRARIQSVKLGSRRLINVVSGDAFFASLPGHGSIKGGL